MSDRLRATLSSLRSLRRRATGAKEKPKRRCRMIEEGATDLDEIPKGRRAPPEADRDRAKAALDRTSVAERPLADIAPELIEQFGRLMPANVMPGEIPFRKP